MYECIPSKQIVCLVSLDHTDLTTNIDDQSQSLL